MSRSTADCSPSLDGPCCDQLSSCATPLPSPFASDIFDSCGRVRDIEKSSSIMLTENRTQNNENGSMLLELTQVTDPDTRSAECSGRGNKRKKKGPEETGMPGWFPPRLGEEGGGLGEQEGLQTPLHLHQFRNKVFMYPFDKENGYLPGTGVCRTKTMEKLATAVAVQAECQEQSQKALAKLRRMRSAKSVGKLKTRQGEFYCPSDYVRKKTVRQMLLEAGVRNRAAVETPRLVTSSNLMQDNQAGESIAQVLCTSTNMDLLVKDTGREVEKRKLEDCVSADEPPSRKSKLVCRLGQERAKECGKTWSSDHPHADRQDRELHLDVSEDISTETSTNRCVPLTGVPDVGRGDSVSSVGAVTKRGTIQSVITGGLKPTISVGSEKNMNTDWKPRKKSNAFQCFPQVSMVRLPISEQGNKHSDQNSHEQREQQNKKASVPVCRSKSGNSQPVRQNGSWTEQQTQQKNSGTNEQCSPGHETAVHRTVFVQQSTEEQRQISKPTDEEEKYVELQTSEQAADLRQTSEQATDLQTSEQATDLQASEQATDLQTSEQSTDLQASEQSTDLQTSEQATDLQASEQSTDLQQTSQLATDIQQTCQLATDTQISQQSTGPQSSVQTAVKTPQCREEYDSNGLSEGEGACCQDAVDGRVEVQDSAHSDKDVSESHHCLDDNHSHGQAPQGSDGVNGSHCCRTAQEGRVHGNHRHENTLEGTESVGNSHYYKNLLEGMNHPHSSHNIPDLSGTKRLSDTSGHAHATEEPELDSGNFSSRARGRTERHDRGSNSTSKDRNRSRHDCGSPGNLSEPELDETAQEGGRQDVNAVTKGQEAVGDVTEKCCGHETDYSSAWSAQIVLDEHSTIVYHSDSGNDGEDRDIFSQTDTDKIQGCSGLTGTAESERSRQHLVRSLPIVEKCGKYISSEAIHDGEIEALYRAPFMLVIHQSASGSTAPREETPGTDAFTDQPLNKASVSTTDASTEQPLNRASVSTADTSTEQPLNRASVSAADTSTEQALSRASVSTADTSTEQPLNRASVSTSDTSTEHPFSRAFVSIAERLAWEEVEDWSYHSPPYSPHIPELFSTHTESYESCPSRTVPNTADENWATESLQPVSVDSDAVVGAEVSLTDGQTLLPAGSCQSVSSECGCAKDVENTECCTGSTQHKTEDAASHWEKNAAGLSVPVQHFAPKWMADGMVNTSSVLTGMPDIPPGGNTGTLGNPVPLSLDGHVVSPDHFSKDSFLNESRWDVDRLTPTSMFVSSENLSSVDIGQNLPSNFEQHSYKSVEGHTQLTARHAPWHRESQTSQSVLLPVPLENKCQTFTSLTKRKTMRRHCEAHAVHTGEVDALVEWIEGLESSGHHGSKQWIEGLESSGHHGSKQWIEGLESSGHHGSKQWIEGLESSDHHGSKQWMEGLDNSGHHGSKQWMEGLENSGHHGSKQWMEGLDNSGHHGSKQWMEGLENSGHHGSKQWMEGLENSGHHGGKPSTVGSVRQCSGVDEDRRETAEIPTLVQSPEFRLVEQGDMQSACGTGQPCGSAVLITSCVQEPKIAVSSTVTSQHCSTDSVEEEEEIGLEHRNPENCYVDSDLNDPSDPGDPSLDMLLQILHQHTAVHDSVQTFPRPLLPSWCISDAVSPAHPPSPPIDGGHRMDLFHTGTDRHHQSFSRTVHTSASGQGVCFPENFLFGLAGVSVSAPSAERPGPVSEVFRQSSSSEHPGQFGVSLVTHPGVPHDTRYDWDFLTTNTPSVDMSSQAMSSSGAGQHGCQEISKRELDPEQFDPGAVVRASEAKPAFPIPESHTCCVAGERTDLTVLAKRLFQCGDAGSCDWDSAPPDSEEDLPGSVHADCPFVPAGTSHPPLSGPQHLCCCGLTALGGCETGAPCSVTLLNHNQLPSVASSLTSFNHSLSSVTSSLMSASCSLSSVTSSLTSVNHSLSSVTSVNHSLSSSVTSLNHNLSSSLTLFDHSLSSVTSLSHGLSCMSWCESGNTVLTASLPSFPLCAVSAVEASSPPSSSTLVREPPSAVHTSADPPDAWNTLLAIPHQQKPPVTPHPFVEDETLQLIFSEPMGPASSTEIPCLTLPAPPSKQSYQSDLPGTSVSVAGVCPKLESPASRSEEEASESMASQWPWSSARAHGVQFMTINMSAISADRFMEEHCRTSQHALSPSETTKFSQRVTSRSKKKCRKSLEYYFSKSKLKSTECSENDFTEPHQMSSKVSDSVVSEFSQSSEVSLSNTRETSKQNPSKALSKPDQNKSEAIQAKSKSEPKPLRWPLSKSKPDMLSKKFEVGERTLSDTPSSVSSIPSLCAAAGSEHSVATIAQSSGAGDSPPEGFMTPSSHAGRGSSASSPAPADTEENSVKFCNQLSPLTVPVLPPLVMSEPSLPLTLSSVSLGTPGSSPLKYVVTPVPDNTYHPCPCHPLTVGGVMVEGEDDRPGPPCIPFSPALVGCPPMKCLPPVAACPQDLPHCPTHLRPGVYQYSPCAEDIHAVQSLYSRCRHNRPDHLYKKCPARFYLQTLCVGDFTFTIEDEKYGKNSRVYFMFMKRKMWYKLELMQPPGDSSGVQSAPQLVTVEIDLKSVVGLWGRDNKLLLELLRPPNMYIGEKWCRRPRRPFDISGGEMGRVPYHFLTFQSGCARTFKRYLCQHPFFCHLLVRPVTVDLRKTFPPAHLSTSPSAGDPGV
ncbi:uncharacterized protein LOC143280944 isoform X2 [Babylonia areolata]|uniref:uncharacterized protein LOC143280944 isoform X2 n=1 Tax=Babylonia areolata TaxID=304850 RepID=UPI003FD5C705